MKEQLTEKQLYDMFSRESRYHEGEYLIKIEKEDNLFIIKSDSPAELFAMFKEKVNEG